MESRVSRCSPLYREVRALPRGDMTLHIGSYHKILQAGSQVVTGVVVAIVGAVHHDA